MVTKKLFILLSTFTLLLSACSAVPKDDGVHVPDIPTDDPIETDPPEDNPPDDNPPDDNPPDDNPPDDNPPVENHIEFEDLADYYYVGETFDNVYRLNVTLFYNGTERDISIRSSYLKFALKDSAGNAVDPSTPFEKAGNYSLQVILKQDETITSEWKSIVVKNSPSKELKTKTVLPSGFTYQDFEDSCRSNLSLPTLGDVNVLVIPVEVSDYPFTNAGYGDEYLSAINRAFRGNGPTDTGYWESISSYYKKSSRNQLNLNFEISEVYKCGHDSNYFLSNGTGAAFYMAEEALDNYKSVHGADSVQKFDRNKDGYIDGLWMVYSAPDYSTGAYGSAQADVFWAFCADYGAKDPNVNSPTSHSFGWASIDFLLNGTEAPNVDTHTFIHETGHLLSLPDYYSYDLGASNASGAQGGLTMMDLNIGDQDAFSKMSLGWSDPYVVTEDCVVTLKPNESSGDCILLADSWNGTAFDEYILLDLQTPTGLNEMDSTTAYYGRPKYYSVPGVRAYHIDARLGEFKYYTSKDGVPYDGIYPVKNDGQNDYYMTDNLVKNVVSKGKLSPMTTDKDVPLTQRNSGYTVINANSGTRTMISESLYQNNRLITLVGADGKHPEIDGKMGSNDALFKKGDSWATNGKVLKFFSGSEGIFNNGDEFSYIFTVLECSTTEAKVQIRKLANK